VRRFFLIFALFFADFAFGGHLPVLGPNLEYGMHGLAAPAGFKGAFVPQARVNLDFSWFEPLGDKGYGAWEANKTNYIRFFADAEFSPFYGAVKAGIGAAPLPPPFAILELRFVYSNENIWSDVEMPMKPGDEELPPIKEAWNARYMFGKLYNRSSYSQIQSFDMQLGGKYVCRNFDISFLLGFALIDINSSYDKKSFDHIRGIPLYSRDYVITEELSAAYNFKKHFSWNVDYISVSSGRQPGVVISYDKEPLFYHLLLTGPSWIFNENKSCLSLSAGFYTRSSSDDSFKDPINEKIILSIKYKHFWNFKFGKD
jgi:hypothetical protein